MLCSIAQIPRSSYYYSQNSAKQEKKDLELRDEILLLPEIIQKTYGTMRKTQHFKNVIGKNINHKRIERVAKLYNLQAVIRRNTHPKDYYKKAKERKLLVPKNILNRNFESEKPFLKLVTDISYFRITNGWLYLCCIKDLYDSSVVSYRCSHNIDAQLTTQTLEYIKCKTISNNTLIHSDQGSQYLSDAFSAELMEQNLIQSLSRRGNCWDNACMESFFGTIKYETGYFDMLKTQNIGYNDMSAKIDEYISFYNNERIQKKLNWRTPVQYMNSKS